MEIMNVVDRKKKLFELLEDAKIKTVVLHGEAGVGKTWTAREVTNYAKQDNAKRKRTFDFVLWVYLNRNYDENALRVSIAQQLSLLPTRGVSEVEEGVEKLRTEEKLEDNVIDGNIKDKIKDKKLLVVFDDEGNKMKEKDIEKLLDRWLEGHPYKVLITTRNAPNDVVTDAITEKNVRKTLQVNPMIREESLILLKERPELAGAAEAEEIDAYAENFMGKTKDIPSAIVTVVKMLKYIAVNDMGGVASDDRIYNIMDVLRSGYDLIPFIILIDCQRDAKEKERPYLSDSRCTNHNELIAYWMMEGYLGHITSMDTAYRKGHEILMELLDLQILKRAEADYVTIDPLNEDLDEFIFQRKSDYFLRGYYSRARLGLDSVFDKVGWKGDLVRLSHKGGVMRTLPDGKGEKKVSVLILDGNSLAKELPRSPKKLQVLAIFNPTLKMLDPLSDDIIRLLYVFVLRSCQFLKNLNQVHRIEKYDNLTVLEISGPIDSVLDNSENADISTSSTFSEFPDDFFERMPNLQSLNFSSLPIKLLPPSLNKLKELKWLILRECKSLTTLNSLKDCSKLMVLDCSGSTSLAVLQDRSFTNPALEMINLSDTKISILPLVSTLKNLTHLLISKCTSLNRLRSIKDIASLEVIDLSGSRDFNEFYDKSLANLVKLKILDLSGTAIGTLPSDIGKPVRICLENCTQLVGEKTPECLSKMTNLEHFVISNAGIQSLPSISDLTNLRLLSLTYCRDLEEVPDLNSLEKLEELDFSGCIKINSIPDNAFEKMCCLQKLNLSGTSIKSLPSLANPNDLRILLLKDCKELTTISSLTSNSLEKLEELSIRGGKNLKHIDVNFFDGTVNLHILDLSETAIDKLPSFLKLEKIRELRLRNCKGLKVVSNIETLTSLEILDLSGSAVSDLLSLSNLSKLRELMLNNCSSLSYFQEMRILDVLGGPIQDLPYGISTLTSLDRLDLPSKDDFQGEETDCEWGISSLLTSNENKPYVSVSGAQVIKPLEKDTKFHLCVYSTKDEKSVPHFRGDDSVYSDIYFTNRYIGESDDQKLLEISGFTGNKPADIDAVFKLANQVFFVDNKFQGSEDKTCTLPSFLAACDSKKIKGCWIEKCGEIEVLFGEKELSKIVSVQNSVETLWVSNALKLKSIFDIPKDSNSGNESSEEEVFQELQKLYLEYCPELSTIISLKKPPQKLKTLQIKFSNNLRKVFDLKLPETKLQYLETLHLWELPELETIGCQLPSLKTIKISNCLKLQKVEETIKSAENLENLFISNVHDFKTLHVSKKMKYLSVERCPNLLKIIALSQPPSDLDIRIIFCKKVETLFEEGTSSEIKLLHLHGLPKLHRIGAKLPNHANRFIVDCLNLKTDV